MLGGRARAAITFATVFGMLAASAAGTAFTVNSVQSIAVASAASDTVVTEPCDGAYDISWSVLSGEIVGVRAVRIPPSSVSDPGLERCARVPYAVLIADRDDVTDADGELDPSSAAWQPEWTGVTNGVTAEIDASMTLPASGALPLSAGMAVQLVIGAGLLDRAVLVPLDCEELASGGTVSQVTIGGVEYCIHVFDVVGADGTFEVLDWRVHRVDYLVVGGGGGGAARDVGGGGGAGGVLTGVRMLDPGEEFPVVVGAGAARNTNFNSGQASGRDGAPSSVFGVTALGGGGGAGWGSASRLGGSGGGGTGIPPLVDGARISIGGAGTDGQGFAGGAGRYPTTTVENPFYGGGGGGGASEPGRSAEEGRHGGDGLDVSATFGTGIGVAGVVGGGGGGAGHRSQGNTTMGRGGAGGGGAAGASAGGAGTPGTGGGGGASRGEFVGGGAGGSGVVVLRYRRS
jgi:hypothetical protein